LDRQDVVGQFPGAPLRCGWFGYLRGRQPGMVVRAFAVLPDGRSVSPIGQLALP
jgi:hypothetical protein